MGREFLFTSSLLQLMSLSSYVTYSIMLWWIPLSKNEKWSGENCNWEWNDFFHELGQIAEPVVKYFVLIMANFAVHNAARDEMETSYPLKRRLLASWLNIVGLYTLCYYGLLLYRVDWRTWSMENFDKVEMFFVVWNLITFIFVHGYENKCEAEEEERQEELDKILRRQTQHQQDDIDVAPQEQQRRPLRSIIIPNPSHNNDRKISV